MFAPFSLTSAVSVAVAIATASALAGCAQASSGDPAAFADAAIRFDGAMVSSDGNPGLADANLPADATVPVEVTLQAGDENTITAANSISCSQAGVHRDNRYLRTYVLADAGITTDFVVSSVQVGIETAESIAGTQPIEVALHTLAGPLLIANLTEIERVSVDVPPQTGSILSVPIAGTVPAGSTLVVEVFTPDGTGSDNVFFIGSNRAGEDTPSFLVGPDCSNPEPTAAGDLGVAGLIMSIVLNVTGEHTSP